MRARPPPVAARCRRGAGVSLATKAASSLRSARSRPAPGSRSRMRATRTAVTAASRRRARSRPTTERRPGVRRRSVGLLGFVRPGRQLGARQLGRVATTVAVTAARAPTTQDPRARAAPGPDRAGPAVQARAPRRVPALPVPARRPQAARRAPRAHRARARFVELRLGLAELRLGVLQLRLGLGQLRLGLRELRLGLVRVQSSGSAPRLRSGSGTSGSGISGSGTSASSPRGRPARGPPPPPRPGSASASPPPRRRRRTASPGSGSSDPPSPAPDSIRFGLLRLGLLPRATSPRASRPRRRRRPPAAGRGRTRRTSPAGRARRRSISASRALEEELVVDLEDEPGLEPGLGEAPWQLTIATLMMSAAVPWITVLTASRSPSRRRWRLPERSSGMLPAAAHERRHVALAARRARSSRR